MSARTRLVLSVLVLILLSLGIAGMVSFVDWSVPLAGGIFVLTLVGAIALAWIEYPMVRRIESTSGELTPDELALRENQQRFQIVADYTYDWESWFGGDGKLQWVNPAVFRMTGYSVEECLEMADYPLELVLEEDRETFEDYLDLACAGETGNDREFRIEHKDGSVIYAAISWQPAFGDENRNFGFRTSVRDITDRKHAEDALKESQRKFQIIADYTYDWESWFDSDGNLQWVNPAVSRMTGYGVEECLAMQDYPLPLVMKEDRKKFMDYLVRAIAGEMANDQEFRIEGKNGGVIHAAISWQPAYDEDHHSFGFRTSVRDITDRKRAEEALKENELRLEARVRERTVELADANRKLQEEIHQRSHAEEQAHKERDFAERLLETAQAIVLLLDTEGRVVRFNPYLEKVSGYRLEEVEKREWADIFLPERFRHGFRALFVRAIGDTPIKGRITPVVTKSGEEREIEWYDRTLKDHEGKIVGLLCIGQDITERKRAEKDAHRLRAELAHVNRIVTMGELATGLAHELNQPLCAILANAEAARILMTSEYPDLDILKETLDDVSAEGQRSVDIINRLRSFIKRGEPKNDPLNLNEIIKESVNFLRIDQQLEVRVMLDLAEELSLVAGDRIQLQQVLLNLMRNGLDAMGNREAASKILVIQTTMGKDGSVELAVVDRGAGIPSEHLDLIFEPFFTTKPDGIGMGLSICRTIIEAHGGRLWASTNPDEGATFRFSLPPVDPTKPVKEVSP